MRQSQTNVTWKVKRGDIVKADGEWGLVVSEGREDTQNPGLPFGFQQENNDTIGYLHLRD